MSKRLRLVIVSAVYPPEPLVSARISFDLAERCALLGWDVFVLCPRPSRPVGTDYSSFCSGNGSVDGASGVRVARLPSFVYPTGGLVGRWFESWSFGHSCARALADLSIEPDVVYVNAWPLLAQRLVVDCARRIGSASVLHVQDVYPEALLPKLPGVVRPMTKAVLSRMDRRTAERANRLIVVSRAMRDLYVRDRGLPAYKVALCQNWQDEGVFFVGESREAARARFGIKPEGFVFLYLGNIGPVAGVESVVRAFDKARPIGARLVVVGGGSRKEACEQLAKELNCPNIHFLSLPDAAATGAIHAMANVCLLPMRRGTALGSVPSKLAGYLLAGKPVLATVDEGSDTAATVLDSGGGWIGQPEDIDWLAAEMVRLAGVDQTALDSIGQRGRQYALEHFSRRIGVTRLAALIEDVAVARGPGR